MRLSRTAWILIIVAAVVGTVAWLERPAPDRINDSLPLQEAAAAGDIEGVRSLLEAGEPPDTLDLIGRAAVHAAVASERDPEVVLAVLTALTDGQANIGRLDANGHNALVTFVHHADGGPGDVRVADFLIAHGIDPCVELPETNLASGDIADLAQLAAARGHEPDLARFFERVLDSC